MRDYKAEYRRRIERATERGLSRAQARGHPKASEQPLRAQSTQPIGFSDERFEEALRAVRRGQGVTQAAKAQRISSERLRRFLKDRSLAHREGKKWVVTDSRPRRVTIYSKRQFQEVVVANFDEASIAGAYWDAAHRFVSTNNVDLLAPFVGKGVKDIKGKRHPLETDPNAIHRLVSAGTPAFHEIYRIVQ